MVSQAWNLSDTLWRLKDCYFSPDGQFFLKINCLFLLYRMTFSEKKSLVVLLLQSAWHGALLCSNSSWAVTKFPFKRSIQCSAVPRSVETHWKLMELARGTQKLQVFESTKHYFFLVWGLSTFTLIWVTDMSARHFNQSLPLTSS